MTSFSGGSEKLREVDSEKASWKRMEMNAGLSTEDFASSRAWRLRLVACC